MADTSVSLVARAKDLTKPVFNTLNRQLKLLKRGIREYKRGADAATKATRGLSRQSVGLRSLGREIFALTGTIGLVVTAFNTLKKAATSAIDAQVARVSSINTVVATLGLNENKAAAFVQNFNTNVSKLGRDLPTSAENIRSISRTIIDDYSQALKSAGASTNQIKDVLLSTSSRAALAGDIAGVSIRDSQAAVSALLSGSLGARGLARYKFFSENTLLTRELQSQLGARNARSFGDLSQLERIKIFTEALEKTITDDAIKRLKGTAKSNISAFVDTLTDENIGIFSPSRDLDPNTAGYQSVFSSFQKTLELVIGKDGLFYQLGRLTGLENDSILKVAKAGIDNFNSWLKSIIDIFKTINVGDAGAIGEIIGRISANITNTVTGGLLKALASINYGAVIIAIIRGVISFFVNLDWKVYAVAAVALLGAFIVPTVIAGLAVIAKAALIALVGLLGGIPALIAGAIILGIVAIVKLLQANWKTIVGIWNGFVNFLKNLVKSVVNKWVTDTKFLLNLLKIILTAPIKALKIVVNVVNSLTSNLVRLTKRLANAAIKPIQGAIQGAKQIVPKPVRQTISPDPVTIISATGGGVPGLASTLAARAITNLIPRYQGGQIPFAANGFLSAISQEVLKKPTNSGLVVANTSEAILTESQFSNLVSSTFRRGQASANSGVSVNFGRGSIVFNLPTGTPQEIAMEAIKIIENALQNELEGRLV